MPVTKSASKANAKNRPETNEREAETMPDSPTPTTSYAPADYEQRYRQTAAAIAKGESVPQEQIDVVLVATGRTAEQLAADVETQRRRRSVPDLLADADEAEKELGPLGKARDAAAAKLAKVKAEAARMESEARQHLSDASEDLGTAERRVRYARSDAAEILQATSDHQVLDAAAAEAARASRERNDVEAKLGILDIGPERLRTVRERADAAPATRRGVRDRDQRTHPAGAGGNRGDVPSRPIRRGGVGLAGRAPACPGGSECATNRAVTRSSVQVCSVSKEGGGRRGNPKGGSP